jgi:PAS domain S-box-containing protein
MGGPHKPTEHPESARLEHERLASLIGSMGDGVLAIDDNLKVVMCNGAALNILDVNGNITGRKISSILKLYDSNGQSVDVEASITESKTSTATRDKLLHYDDGSKANIYVSVAPVRLGYGEEGEKGYVILLRDITREKSLEEERDEFISVVSHELRTPIAIAEGNISNAEFMNEKGSDPVLIKESLHVAHQQVLFLAGMINDLATLSRAERGVLQVEVESINTHELCQDLRKTYEPEAKAKGLMLRIDLDPHLELLQSSKLYVREILQNFITNSIKYTEKGSVVLRAKSDKKGVVFTVSDTGIGISKADKERVFDKFFRSEDFRTRANSGTGLGLYVTMKLARLIHAEMRVESELDKGSVFTITVPNLSPEHKH